MAYALPEPNTGCWLWTGALFSSGYGSLNVAQKTVRAHRFGYEYFHGKIPDGHVLDHKCRVKCCVNPDHLEAVSQKVNVERHYLNYVRKTHCPQGHAYAGTNLYTNPQTGDRQCRACLSVAMKKWRTKRAECGDLHAG